MLNAYPQIDPQKTYARKTPTPGYTIQLLSRLLTILNVLCVCFLDIPALMALLIQYSSCNCATSFTRLGFGIHMLFSPLFKVVVHTYVPGGFFGAME